MIYRYESTVNPRAWFEISEFNDCIMTRSELNETWSQIFGFETMYEALKFYDKSMYWKFVYAHNHDKPMPNSVSPDDACDCDWTEVYQQGCRKGHK